jgi:hypothetical protein
MKRRLDPRLRQVSFLIRKGEFDRAYGILVQMDDPTAHMWLERLDELRSGDVDRHSPLFDIERPARSLLRAALVWIGVMLLFAVGGGIFGITRQRDLSALATITQQAVERVAATETAKAEATFKALATESDGTLTYIIFITGTPTPGN